jgi:hypothetical protein
MKIDGETRRTPQLVYLLEPGDCFAYDVQGTEGGDVLYGEVLELVPKFEPGTDWVGPGSGGYRVRMYCEADKRQGTPEGAVDFYSWEYMDRIVLLSGYEMNRARQAGWPRRRAFLASQFGIVLRDAR